MLERLKQLLAASIDIKMTTQTNSELSIEVAYIAPLCDEKLVNEFIFVPFAKEIVSFRKELHTIPQYIKVHDPATWTELLLSGFVLIEADGEIYSFYAARIISDLSPVTTVENAIQGPQLALNEDVEKSLNLLRTMYPSPEFASEEHTLGYLSKTPVVLAYDQKRVDPVVLRNVRKKLTEIETEMIQAAGEIARELVGGRKHLFPTVLVTERPDRITRALAQGKITLLIKGSRFGLILPATFFDFMHAVEDDYESFWMTRTLLILRYIAVILTVVLPAIYIALASYNPELVRVQLAFSVNGSRAAVPYPSFIEVMLMLFMIEALVEASTRLPRYIGSTATTVGGLILGQAAQQAGLVSSIMIIVTSVVAISNFVVPINPLMTSVRFLKYTLIPLAVFFGISGVTVGFFAILVYMCNLRSFGKPYLRIFGDLQKQQGDIGQVNSK
ncbi:spore germination protein [Paenibacillus thailandensis]|uniref:Spore germination protein n=1 Tax=Paenibacillus thailandensis TaxID=393250 RepID=A0ABW5QS13_9BACL